MILSSHCLQSLLEEKLIHDIAKDFQQDRGKKMVGCFSLAEFLSIIRHPSLLITSSTGPLHLANAVRTPLLGFFCSAKPQTPKRWGPYDQHKWVVTLKLDSPEICSFYKCPHGGCLQQLSDSKFTTELCEKRLKDLT